MQCNSIIYLLWNSIWRATLASREYAGPDEADPFGPERAAVSGWLVAKVGPVHERAGHPAPSVREPFANAWQTAVND